MHNFTRDFTRRWRALVLMIKGFADIVIVDITAGQINHYFTEIAPCTVYPLYGNPCIEVWGPNTLFFKSFWGNGPPVPTPMADTILELFWNN